MNDEIDAAERSPTAAAAELETTSDIGVHRFVNFANNYRKRMARIEDRLDQLEFDYKAIRDNAGPREGRTTSTSGFQIQLGGGTVFAIFAAYWLFKGASAKP